jgi:uncharacterized protein (TIGR02996 family)
MEQQALLNVIRANPDDRTARLVYADWLDENGEALLASYARAEGELMAHEPGAPEWHDAIDRLLTICARAGQNLGGWEYAEDAERIVRRRKGMSLAPPVGERDLLQFEKRHEIALPGEYRAFLLRVGNGWTNFFRLELPHLDCDVIIPQLRQVFPYGAADATRLLLRLKDGFKPEGMSFQGRGADNTNEGCLLLTDFGNGNVARLVVRGELRGQVWVEGDFTGFNPWAADDFVRPTGFFEYFETIFLAK